MNRALEVVDAALLQVATSNVRFMTSREVDEKFERATEVLSLYEQYFFRPRGPLSNDHSSRSIRELMAAAKEKDTIPAVLSNSINSLKDKVEVSEDVSLFLD